MTTLHFTAALTAAVEADLAAAESDFPSSTLTWKWTLPDAARVQFRASFNDSPLSLVIEVPLVGGPSLYYRDALMWLEEEYSVSSTQTATRSVALPDPTDVERSGFTAFAAVLQYVADWRDRLAGPP